MFRVMGSMMPYRNRAYDIYKRNFSEASAVGFLSAILFTVFSEPVKNLVDFGEKWMELSGIPYQMNIAMLGFIVGYGSTKMFLLMRMQLFKMLLAYQGWMFNPKSTTTKVNIRGPNCALDLTLPSATHFGAGMSCSEKIILRGAYISNFKKDIYITINLLLH